MKWFIRFAGLLGLLGVMFYVGYGVRDFTRGRMPSKDSLTKMVTIPVSNADVAPGDLFKTHYKHISSTFYKEVNPGELKYAGMSGLMASLGDPHTLFMEPRAAKEFKLETSAKFAGIGARLSPDPLGARVAVVFDEGPANRAGVKPGDLITAVNAVKVSGWDVNDIVDRVRGPEKSIVNLTVSREKAPAPLTFKITRAQITVPTVTSKKIPGTNYGFVDISMFSEPTAAQFEKALDKLEGEGIQGLVIDLRFNPGGLLDSAIDVLSLFVENKRAVTIRMREGAAQSVNTTVGRARQFRYPIAVLVNSDSASAAEIMSGVLKDYKIATLVGEHTYGKASVQNIFPLTDGSSAKVTIAKYFLPSGVDIARKVDEDGQFLSGGIQVDHLIKLQESPVPEIGNPKTDNQLQKALQILGGKGTSVFVAPPSGNGLTISRVEPSAQAIAYEV